MHANYFICLRSAKKFRHCLMEGGGGSSSSGGGVVHPASSEGALCMIELNYWRTKPATKLRARFAHFRWFATPPTAPSLHCPLSTAVSDALWIFVCASFQPCPTLHSFRRCGCGCDWSGLRIGCIKDFMYADCVAHVNPFNSVIRNGKCHGNTHSHSDAHTHKHSHILARTEQSIT